MILNEIIFVILCVEALICVLLVLPFGNEICKSIVESISSMIGHNSTLSTLVNCTVGFVALVFLTNLQESYKLKLSDTILSDGSRIQLLLAQRNMYISGFSLFLLLLLRLVYSSMETNIKLQKSLQAMEKQAKGASDGYKTLLEENEKTEKKLKKLESLTKTESNGELSLDGLLTDNANLEQQLEGSQKKLKESNSLVDTLKKQAESRSDAYIKLMDENKSFAKEKKNVEAVKSQISNQAKAYEQLLEENKSLKSQLADYDFMFADTKKKEI